MCKRSRDCTQTHENRLIEVYGSICWAIVGGQVNVVLYIFIGIGTVYRGHLHRDCITKFVIEDRAVRVKDDRCIYVGFSVMCTLVTTHCD